MIRLNKLPILVMASAITAIAQSAKPARVELLDAAGRPQVEFACGEIRAALASQRVSALRRDLGLNLLRRFKARFDSSSQLRRRSLETSLRGSALSHYDQTLCLRPIPSASSMREVPHVRFWQRIRLGRRMAALVWPRPFAWAPSQVLRAATMLRSSRTAGSSSTSPDIKG